MLGRHGGELWVMFVLLTAIVTLTIEVEKLCGQYV